MRRALTALALAVASVVAVSLFGQTRFFRLLELKAYDLQFLWRGPEPTSGIVLVLVDQKTLDRFDEPLLFWHPYYAAAIRAAARGGARVFGLDIFFNIPVEKWEPNNDGLLAKAVVEAAPVMPVVCAFVPGMVEKQRERPIPLYVFAAATGVAASAHLKADPDDFIRRQQLMEEGEGAVRGRTRSLALRVAEMFLGQEVRRRIEGGRLYIGDTQIPIDADGAMVIDYPGPAGTFPRVSLADFLSADENTIRQWVNGKIVLLGFDSITSEDRHATPFYRLTPGLRANTAGVEIQASILHTILQRKFLVEPPARDILVLLLLASGLGVAAAWRWRLRWAALVLGVMAAALLLLSQWLFRRGIVISAPRLLLSQGIAAIAALIYQSENRRAFFARAFSIFVGRRVAESLEDADQIPMASGARRQVTILFSDIRGFTNFCDEREPSSVVEHLNRYLTAMVAIIVRHGGEVNKFIGDGILAVFDQPGPAVQCGLEMVQAPGAFQTGIAIHTGEVVEGNVGSSDKLENTVLGATVNVASRIEGLNKQFGTQMLISEETRRLLDPSIAMMDLGPAEVRGASRPIRVFTPAALASRVVEQVGRLS